MATGTAHAPLIRTHAAARSGFWAFFVPLFLLPVLLGGLAWWDGQETETLAADGTVMTNEVLWWVYALVALVLLAIPASMSLYARLSTRYTVTERTVVQETGLLSRTTSEVRIADIRNIVVRQSFQDRLLKVGTVGFSSAAGDGDEVVFRDVSDPVGIKGTVQQLQDKMGLSAATGSSMSAAPAKASTKPVSGPAEVRDDAAAAELERLLHEQETSSRR